LNQKRASLEARLQENKVHSADDEAALIKKRRMQIADVHEEIKKERERQTMLKAQLEAYEII